MSRYYSMSITVFGLNKAEIDKAQKAAEAQWKFENWFAHDPDDLGNDEAQTNLTLTASGEGNLGGGEPEEEFAERICKSVWHALGRYVPIEVTATFLEDLPYETHTMDEDAYERVMRESETEL